MDDVEEMEVNEMVENTLVFCRGRFKEMGVTLEFLQSHTELCLEGQRTLIGQVLLNLLNNSIDAIVEQTHPWTKIEIKSHHEFVDIVITDSGEGISEEIKDKITQPFYTTKEVGKGTGLGLSISHGIIEKQGGQLLLDDNCQNTRFIIRLPRLTRKAA